MCFKSIFKIFFSLITIQLSKAIYINSGIKLLNKFLYSSRYKTYDNQTKINSCSLIDGPNCYFTEKKYINNKSNNKDYINGEWTNFFNKTKNYEVHNILHYFINYTENYKLKNSNKSDEDQNSKDEVFKYLMTFDNFDKYTINKDIYFDEKIMKQIFFNKEIIMDIEGKLKLSYDKDVSEYYLNVIDKEYPSRTFGIIESNFISISFRGKAFICNFFYIKAHDEESKNKQILLYGYAGSKMIYSYSYTDNKKRREKWLKVFFPLSGPINKLIIAGPYDIDNISFTFPSKRYADSNLYEMYNYKTNKILVKDEDI